MKYVIGAVIGAAVGYFVFYKMIGCASGTCPITSNPLSSTIYGAVIGLLMASAV